MMIIQDFGVLAVPTVPGPPPKLQTEATSLETFRARAFSLLSIAGVSGFCQVLCVYLFVCFETRESCFFLACLC
jgi:hypothetical protein